MRQRRDVRGPVLLFTIFSIGLFGLILARPWFDAEPQGDSTVLISDKSLPDDPDVGQLPVVDVDFRVGIAALQAGDHASALASFRRFAVKAPHVPEAHANLGFTYFGLDRLSEAEESFLLAIQLRPGQANAYYGLGLIYESLGDLEQARGAMRTFIHLADDSEPFLRKARAALWEWENSATEPQGPTAEK